MSNQAVAGFRLSIQQERIWSQQSGLNTVFWSRSKVIIQGTLDAKRLQDAIRTVVGSHEILRTVFHRQAGLKVPFQVILESPNFAWTTADLSGFSVETQRDDVARLAAASIAGFDLETGPMLHVLLAKQSPLDSILVLSLPALCADRCSLQNLAAEIIRNYAVATDTTDEIMQYADVAEWQQEMLVGDESKLARDYWRDYLRQIDFTALDSILSAFETKTSGQFSPRFVTKRIEIESLGGVGDPSLSDFILGCWFAFLFRMTGRPNIVVGCEFEGRSYAELADALGVFAKNLPLHVECNDGASLRSLVTRAGRDSADFRNWQDGFSWSDAALPAGQEQGPILPVAFEYVEVPATPVYDDLKITTVQQEVHNERFVLKLSVQREGGVLDLAFYYDEGRLARETVDRWGRHFLSLLKSAAADEDTARASLALLDETERSKMLTQWNQTSAAFPRTHLIHDLIEAQAAKTPHAPAVRFQDDRLSYQHLNEQANRLAHHLRGKGVRANSLVGLCMERSTGMMVAVLAILKAGGAYVPLSADHPKRRLTQQLSGATALIIESKFECLMPEFSGSMILFDQQIEQWSNQPLTNPQPVTSPEDYAYVIYTSGSTGTPKGVAVRHRNLVNYTSFIQHRLELAKEPSPLSFATVSTLGADLGNTCIYPSLVSGGCLHVIGSDVAADSQRLGEYMTKHRVDVLKIVPSHLMALLNAGGGKEVLPRRYLIMGGEAFTGPLMEKIVSTGCTCGILNHYGPTETTVGSLTLRLSDFDWKRSGAQSIPIGRPIANTRIYVLDTRGEPVPIGVAGELYIAGEGVAAGYVNQPERTAERFVADRFSPDPKSTMYRTGDLVRYLSDGNVEFLGRVDDQVKIRGFRIELGEIESVLMQHPGVKHAIALTTADERGEKSLVAYVVGTASCDELRTYLRGQLPDYMAPSTIINLPKLPLNSNGKVDRQALPKPEEIRAAHKEGIAPRSPSEEVVAAIWSEVLKRDNIGVDDNFFEIGGHSLLATQIASRLREHFRVPVAVRAIFEAPSIAEMANRMDTARREEQGMLPPPITPLPRDGGFPLSFAQERLWVLDQMDPNNPLYNIPRSLRLKGLLRADALEKAINEIVRRHESQRTTFSVKDGRPLQVIHESLLVPLEVHDLSAFPGPEREAEARRISIEDSMRPFDLKLGPLVRAHLTRLSAEEHILQLTMHHIISDAWSAGIFLQEMGTLYEAFSADMPSPLPELKVQYADYAVQEREWLDGEALEKQLVFWRERLKGFPPVLELPFDHERPKNRTFAGACEMLHIPAELLAKVKELGRQEGTTLFMTLVAVFQILLSKYSGQDQIVVGTDLANRTMPETERMIGFFINLMAVPADLSGNPTFRELLGRVREGLLDAYAHQEVPFPKIVQAVQPERSATHNPIVQVLFVMQNIPRAKRQLAGLEVEPFEVPITTSKFDMALFIGERPDGLIGYWVYSTELFEQATIQRMLRHFFNLLESAVSDPDARLSSLAMLSPEELEQQEAERRKRKVSQFGKLKATTPEAVGLRNEEQP